MIENSLRYSQDELPKSNKRKVCNNQMNIIGSNEQGHSSIQSVSNFTKKTIDSNTGESQRRLRIRQMVQQAHKNKLNSQR